LGDVDAVIARAAAAGTERILAVGTDLSTSETCVALAEQFDLVFAAVGVHPYDAASVDPPALDLLRRLAGHPKVVAIGETGLDYERSPAPPEVQRAAFAAQAALAATLELPVVIHNRSADNDVIKIVASVVRPAALADRAGVLHCFTGDVALAREGRQNGLRISFAGNLTYRRSAELRAVAVELPLEWLMTETDSPYLAPEPYRGKPNAPANVEFVVRAIATARGISCDDVAARVRANARELFEWPLADGRAIAR
jgi:TatD DNase family protein